MRYFDETGFGEVEAEDENLVVDISEMTKSRVMDEGLYHCDGLYAA